MNQKEGVTIGGARAAVANLKQAKSLSFERSEVETHVRPSFVHNGIAVGGGKTYGAAEASQKPFRAAKIGKNS